MTLISRFLFASPSAAERLIAGLISGGLLVLTAISFAWRNHVLVAEGGGNFQHSDWLVNYAEGLVRRGISGELVFFVADLTRFNPLQIVEFIQTSALWLLVVFCLFIFARLGFPTRLAVLLASPAFILAWHNEFETHGKEIIAFLAFLPLLYAALNQSAQIAAHLIAAVLFVVSAFLHEAMVLLAPALIACSYFACRPGAQWRLFVTFTISVSVGALVVAGFTVGFSRIDDHPGMCARVLSYGVQDVTCGMFVWFTETASHARDFTLGAIDRRSPVRFVLALIAAYTPVAIILWPVRPYWKVLLGLAGTFLLFVPLYIVAIDYGRWLNMQIASITFVFIAALASGSAPDLAKPLNRAFLWGLLGAALTWRVSLVSGGIGAGVLKPVVLWALLLV